MIKIETAEAKATQNRKKPRVAFYVNFIGGLTTVYFHYDHIILHSLEAPKT